MAINGFVLAGGKSSRMGIDKAFIEFENKLLFEYSVEKIRLFCTNIFISTNNLQFKDLGYKIIEDKFKDCGPLCGIYSSLLFSDTEKNLFIPCDTPFIPQGLISEIIEYRNFYDIIVPTYNGFTEPLIGLYSKKIIDIVEKLIKEQHFKISNLFKQTNVKYLNIDKNKPYFDTKMFENFNSPQELEKYKK